MITHRHTLLTGQADLSTGLELPDSWGKGFSALETLTLSGQGFQGTLPPAWGEAETFPSLFQLYLDGNNFTGGPWLAATAHLLVTLHQVDKHATGPGLPCYLAIHHACEHLPMDCTVSPALMCT